MSRERSDGSVESANTPDFFERSIESDHALYQCMITKVFYTDSSENITKGSANPQVMYEGIIVGGTKEGQVINNIRDGARLLGGFGNYEEQVLRAADPSKSFNLLKGGDSATRQDGDIVYVAFLGGNPLYPVILGKGTQPKDSTQTGAKSGDGPRQRSEYNGVFKEIDKNGNLIIKRKGGSYDAAKRVFNAASGNEASLELNAKKAEIAGGGGAKIKADDSKVAIGTSSVELLQQIVDILEKVITWVDSTGSVHTHLGNLGYPTAPPTQSAGYTQLSSDLAAIKSKINQIKGSF